MANTATPTPTLLHKALWYSAAAAGVAGMTAIDADAQVVYTDIDDVVVTDTGDLNANEDGGLLIDFDGDGDPEVIFLEDLDRSYTIMANPDSLAGDPNDAFLGAIGALYPFGGIDYLYPYGLDAGASVGPEKSMLEAGVGTFTFQSSDPNGIIQPGDQFVGLQFSLDGSEEPNYGWIRFEMTTNGSITIKDFAYEATAGEPIIAGTGVATDPGALEVGYLFSEVAPNPIASGTAVFDLAVGQAETVTVDLFDALGRRVQSVFEGPMVPGTTESVTLDTSALPAGVYVVRVSGETFVSTRNVTVVR